jgi:hypothetical protein
MMKTLNVTRNKSFEWSFGLHSGILMVAFLPFAHSVMEKKPVEYILEVDYQDIPVISASGSEGLQARSPVFNEQPEPTTDRPAKEPIPVDQTEPVEQITMAENKNEVITDVTTEADSEVIANKSAGHGTDAETHADGGGSGSPIEGNQNGAAHAGDGGGGDGLEGDGIITRKIIYRENITGAAKISGRITLNVCIDRQGKVVYAGYDPEKTTITDKEIIKQATHLALRYRYEAKYTAPKRECGQLTFIFSIDENVASK